MFLLEDNKQAMPQVPDWGHVHLHDLTVRTFTDALQCFTVLHRSYTFPLNLIQIHFREAAGPMGGGTAACEHKDCSAISTYVQGPCVSERWVHNAGEIPPQE